MKNHFFSNRLIVVAILSFLFINCERDYELEDNKPSKPENNFENGGKGNGKTEKFASDDVYLELGITPEIDVFAKKNTEESETPKLSRRLLTDVIPAGGHGGGPVETDSIETDLDILIGDEQQLFGK